MQIYLSIAILIFQLLLCVPYSFDTYDTLISQDNLKLMDDVSALRPTIFPSVPRLYNRIYAAYVIH